MFSHTFTLVFLFVLLCHPLQTCSSSDLDAVGDVNRALKQHRWDDDGDKERSDWRLRGRSETNAEGEGVERE